MLDESVNLQNRVKGGPTPFFLKLGIANTARLRTREPPVYTGCTLARMVTLELQEDEGPWEQKTTLQGDGIIIIGRSDFSSLPAYLSRQHLALWYDEGVAYTKPLGQNKSFLRRNLTDSIWPEIEALTKGVATAVPLGAVLLLEKSHRFKVRLVGPAPAAASAASAGVAASTDTHPENKEAKEAHPPHSRKLHATVPAAMPAAAAATAVPAVPVVIELGESEQEEDDEVEVEARGVRGRRGKPPPPAAEVVDLEAEEKPEAKAAARRDGKRPLALPAEEEERARPRRPSAAPVPPVHEVIDLEAATGVGVGVSGRPLLPGEQEARRQLQRRSWTAGQVGNKPLNFEALPGASKAPIDKVDACDASNPQYIIPYLQDIHRHYREVEVRAPSPWPNYPTASRGRPTPHSPHPAHALRSPSHSSPSTPRRCT